MDEGANAGIAPMRVQVKVDDGSEAGLWVTMFEGWTDITGSMSGLEESVNLVEAVRRDQEGVTREEQT